MLDISLDNLNELLANKIHMPWMKHLSKTKNDEICINT